MEYGTAEISNEANIKLMGERLSSIQYLIFTSIDDSDVPVWAREAMVHRDITIDEDQPNKCFVHLTEEKTLTCNSGDVILYHILGGYTVVSVDDFLELVELGSIESN